MKANHPCFETMLQHGLLKISKSCHSQSWLCTCWSSEQFQAYLDPNWLLIPTDSETSFKWCTSEKTAQMKWIEETGAL